MILTTLMLIIKDNQMLLGVKKRGFGMGRLNGAGGKVESGESIHDAAIRETEEELGITPLNPRLVGTVVFGDLYYKGVAEDNVMSIFVANDYTGEPSESDEIAPEWHDIDNLPFDRMWGDDYYWMPEILKGKIIEAFFHYNENDEFTEHWIIERGDELIPVGRLEMSQRLAETLHEYTR